MSAPVLPRGHDKYEELAVAWALDALEPADQEIFEEHRGGCDPCALTVFATLEVATELAYGVPDVAPPPRLRQQLLAAAADLPSPARSPESGPAGSGGRHRSADPDPASGSPSYGPGDGHAGTRPDGPRRPEGRRHDGVRTNIERPGGRERGGEDRRRTRRRLVWALAAAVLIGGSAVTTWEITRPAPVSAPAAEGDRVAALTAPDGGATVATIVTRTGKADVVTDGLRPNTGRGTSYYVWGVPAGDGGVPQVVGTFDVTADGLHSYPIRLTRSLDAFPVLAVSEEKAASNPAAPSGIIARGALGR